MGVFGSQPKDAMRRFTAHVALSLRERKPKSPHAAAVALAAISVVGLGLVCLAQKKYDDAVAEFDRAIKWNRKSVIAHHNRGIANRKRDSGNSCFARQVVTAPQAS
jgi:Tfp pilus assembly protein PilF